MNGRLLFVGTLLAGVVGASLIAPPAAHAQVEADTARRPVQDGIFNRPVVGSLGRTSIGGYIEGNSNLAVEDGIGEGFSMELRRFNIFLFSSVGSRIRFISELEFIHGTEEIEIETALIDVAINPSLVVRGGIILPPLGAFNVNHDSPRWNMIDRPLVSTQIIPSTLAEVGFGLHGRLAPRGFGLTYDLYATNGLGDGVILNAEGRTRLAEGKRAEAFAEDNNGSPAFSGRLAAQHRTIGEFGLSFYTGIYNSYRAEGVAADTARRLAIFAVDAITQVGPVELRGEAALASIDVPEDLRELFGHRQFGFHVDASMPVWAPRLRGFPNAVLNADMRVEYIDQNVGRFASTAGNIGDDVTALVFGTSFRPVSGTVFKMNYRRQWARDLLDNTATRLAAFQIGFATYF